MKKSVQFFTVLFLFSLISSPLMAENSIQALMKKDEIVEAPLSSICFGTIGSKHFQIQFDHKNAKEAEKLAMEVFVDAKSIWECNPGFAFKVKPEFKHLYTLTQSEVVAMKVKERDKK